MLYYTKLFNASLESLEAILEWITGHLKANIELHAKLSLIEVALEEIVVNIIEHTYLKREGPIFILLDLSSVKPRIVFRDYGPPFNPLSKNPDTQHPLNIEDLKVGGQGLKFIKAGIEEINYAYASGMNILECKL